MPFIDAFPGPGNKKERSRTSMGGDQGEDLQRGRTTAEDVKTSNLKDEWEDSRRPTMSFEGDATEKVTNNREVNNRDDYPAR